MVTILCNNVWRKLKCVKKRSNEENERKQWNDKSNESNINEKKSNNEKRNNEENETMMKSNVMTMKERRNNG